MPDDNYTFPNGGGGSAGGGGGAGGGYGPNKRGASGGGGPKPLGPPPTRPLAPRVLGPASLLLSSAVGVEAYTAAYAAGELTIASYAAVGTVGVVTGGVLGVVGLGVAVAWGIYELSTDADDPAFPLRQFSAINNPYGVCTFGASTALGNDPLMALDHAQLASDLRAVLQFSQSAALEKLDHDWRTAKDAVSAANAVIRQAEIPFKDKQSPTTSKGPGP